MTRSHDPKTAISPDMLPTFRFMSSDDLARFLRYNKFAIDTNEYKARYPKTVDFIRRKLAAM